MSFGCRGHILAPVVHHLDRPARLQRQKRRVQRQDGRELLLAAETAAGGSLHHPHLMIDSLESVLQRRVDVVGALHRPFRYDGIAFLIGQHALGFEIDVLLGTGFVGPLHDDGCIRQGLFHVALGDGQVFEEVVGAVLDLIGGRHTPEIEDRGKPVDVDGDRRHRPAQRLPRMVGQENDRLVHVSYMNFSQYRLVRLDLLHLIGARDIPMIHHHELRPVHLRPEADFPDPPARGGTADGHAPQTAVHRDVVDIAFLAGELGHPFDSVQDRAPDWRMINCVAQRE